jgi:predicted DCC family thiol-disulfide oxidoreductase YuxK
MSAMADRQASLIIYDGDCIFCANYVRLLRLKQSIGPVDLLDARSDDPRVHQYWRDGYDLNKGMLFVHAGRIYHGDEAINVLASLSGDSTIFNRINGLVLSNAQTARLVYPFLKLGRRIVLVLRGKKLLRHPADLA